MLRRRRAVREGSGLGCQQLLQLARLVHLHHDVRAADELALHVELGDRGPVAVVLDALADSWSSSTLTVEMSLVSTPQALRIWMARPEKPHMGKLALPFMNSRMLLLLTSWSMRCWVSLICVVLRGRGGRRRRGGMDGIISLSARTLKACGIAAPRPELRSERWPALAIARPCSGQCRPGRGDAARRQSRHGAAGRPRHRPGPSHAPSAASRRGPAARAPG